MPDQAAQTQFNNTDTAPTVRTSLNNNATQVTNHLLSMRSRIQAAETHTVYSDEQEQKFQSWRVDGSVIFQDGTSSLRIDAVNSPDTNYLLWMRSFIAPGETLQVRRNESEFKVSPLRVDGSLLAVDSSSSLRIDASSNPVTNSSYWMRSRIFAGESHIINRNEQESKFGSYQVDGSVLLVDSTSQIRISP